MRPQPLQWDRYKYGDLYGLSYLPGYTDEVKLNYVDEMINTDGPDLSLTIIGDSYLESTFKTSHGRVSMGQSEVVAFRWFGVDKSGLPAPKQSSAPNVLLIEMAERFMSYNLSPEGLSIYRSYLTPGVIEQAAGKSWTDQRIVPEDIEQNLETVLFGYRLYAPIKESKAYFNRNILNANRGPVYQNGERDRLYLTSTIDSNLMTSSFCSFGPEQLNRMIKGMEALDQMGRAAGYDEVIITFIPNSATIIPPDGKKYAGLLDAIRLNCGSEVNYLDCYTVMKDYREPEQLYWRGDTHWTRSGFKLWLGELVEILHKLNKDVSVSQ